MKSFIVLSALVFSFTGANAKAKDNSVEQGLKIAEVLVKVLSSEASTVSQDAKEILAKAVNNQPYEERISILKMDCSALKVQRTMFKTCEIDIGTDNTTDDDNGWGSIQRVTVDGVIEKGDFKVRAAKLFFIAG